jgi:hypothetical protein
VSPLRYDLGYCIPEDGTLPSHLLENLKSYITLTAWDIWRRNNVFPVRYKLGFYIPEDGILHSHRPKTSNLIFSVLFYFSEF